MFPYSFGVQAATKAKALTDLGDQVSELTKQHPEKADRYAAHLKAVQDAAVVLVGLLPEDDPDNKSDVAISAAGALDATKNADEKKPDDVQTTSLTVHAQRCPTDERKYAKPVKLAK
jgi:hypothetical protein